MSWLGVEGHDDVVDRFRRSLGRGRLASTFLFVGPEGVGKRTLALKLAQALLCEQTPADVLDACGVCAACAQVEALTHPDMEIVQRPADRAMLPIELLIGDKEHRMREGLCHRIAMRPSRGGRRIAIVDDADYLSQEGANCLLKTLEEPPPRSVLILLSTSAQRQLPTIRSRCQVVPFRALARETLERLLVEKGIVEDVADAEKLAPLAEGSLARAAALNSADLWEFRHELVECFAAGRWQNTTLHEVIKRFIESAGKETAARRDRVRVATACVIEFLRQLTRCLLGAPACGADDLVDGCQRLAQRWDRDAETVADMIQRTLEAATSISSNTNVAIVVEAWVDELVQLYHGETPMRVY